MARGELTAKVAHELQKEIQGVDIFHDHWQKELDSCGKVGKIYSCIGGVDNSKPKSDHILGDIDIAVVWKGTKKVCALIEIEETTANPKVILGDIFATLFGDRIALPDNSENKVCEWTTLIVMVHDVHQLHSLRICYLKKQVNLLKNSLTTHNSSIGKIVIESYKDCDQLKDFLMGEIKTEIGRSNS